MSRFLAAGCLRRAILPLHALVRLEHPLVLATGRDGVLPRAAHLRLELLLGAMGHRVPPARNLGPHPPGRQIALARIGTLTPAGPRLTTRRTAPRLIVGIPTRKKARRRTAAPRGGTGRTEAFRTRRRCDDGTP